jgi:hypothetical protein
MPAIRLRFACLGTGIALAASPVALADRLELSDGRVVEGTVTKEGEDYRVVSRFGENVLPAKDVAKWERAKPFEDEWRERLAALPETDLAGRARLARWLSESGRKAEAEATAALVLEQDPEHAAAHEVLGHVRFRGRWMHPDDANREQGLVRRGDTWYTPAEWELLDPAGKKGAEEAEARAAVARRSEAVNAAIRLMMAKDLSLRAEGERRLLAIAKETESREIETLVPRVREYARANDEMLAAIASPAGGSNGRMIAETRIQMARLKRPIKEIATSLASGPTGVPVSTNSSVVIQLPELEVITVRSTVVLPTN